MGTVHQLHDPFAADVTPPRAPSDRRVFLRTAREIDTMPAAEADWIVRGILARGCLTELTAALKVGKTTFAAEMVRAMHERRPFLGLSTAAGRVIWMTEQGLVSFRVALRRAHLEHYEQELRVVLRQDVAHLPWPQVVRQCVEEDRRLGGGGVLVVDTLSRWAGLAPEQENDPGAAARVTEPLLQAAHQGMAVLGLRHARKAGGDVASAGRGSSAFGGDADIMLLLRREEQNDSDEELSHRSHRRLLESVSRFDETPAQEEPQAIQLFSDGYGITGGTTQDERYSGIDTQILLYIASHAGCGRTEVRETAAIRAKAAVRDSRLSALVQDGKVLEHPVERQDKLGRIRTGAGLWVSPDA